MDQLKGWIRAHSLYAPIRRERLKRLTLTPGWHPDWAALLAGQETEWRDRREAARGGPRVLIATSLGLHSTIGTFDSALAVALTLRGAQVEILLCDKALPACQLAEHRLVPSVARFATQGPQPDLCDACYGAGQRLFAPLGLGIRLLSDLADAPARLEPSDEEHALAGALRFFGRETLDQEPLGELIHGRYRQAAAVARAGATRLIGEGYDLVVAHHGIYVPQGIVAGVAKSAGVRWAAWHTAYRKGCVILEHEDTYHRGLAYESSSRWAERALSPAQDAQLDKYLTDRATGAQDWIQFQSELPRTRAALEAELGLSFDVPTVLLLGSVMWDARLHFPNNAFTSMSEWAIETVRAFAGRPDRQLIIRAHPGEVVSSPAANDRLAEVLARAFPSLPPNVRVVPAESPLNTYALAAFSRSAIAYNSKMPIELAATGMPIIVAGEAWVRGKGFVREASSLEEYLQILEHAPFMPPLDAGMRERARRYAWHFFFRRFIPVAVFEPGPQWPAAKLRADAFDLLKRGADAGMDAICEGLLAGAPFEHDGQP